MATVAADVPFGRLVMLDGLVTDQGRLVAATPQLLDAELASVGDLEFRLACAVPRDWPPEGWDRTTITWLRHRLDEHPHEAGWWAAYLVSHDGVIVGTVGLKGPPRDGEVELGYGLVPSAFGMGYASTAVRAIVEAAARRTDIDRVVAHTRDGADASVAVLERVGFEPDGPGSEPGTQRHVMDVPVG